MKYNYRQRTINGQAFTVWDDFIMRGTYAQDANGVEKCIKASGYLGNDLTERKAIAAAYGLTIFRK